jgi:GNAT superfamily N-acetyltransferase
MMPLTSEPRAREFGIPGPGGRTAEPDVACTVSAQVLPGDRQSLLNLFARSSARTRSSRFHHALSVFPERYLEEILSGRQLALVARDICHHETDGDVIGLSSAARISDSSAEVAVWVDDAWQRHGVGRLLLEKTLTRLAVQGYREAVGFIQPSNLAALRLVERCADAVVRPEGDVLRVSVPLVAADHS